MPRVLTNGAGLLLTFCLSATPAFGDLWDLKSDWSSTANPNGAWSYNVGASSASVMDSTWNSSDFAGGQPAWRTGDFIPAWFQRNAASYRRDLPFDLLEGDIGMHGASRFGGPQANVTWTSPTDFSGSVAVTGATWMARDLGREMDWALYLNGDSVASGHLNPSVGRANPSTFNLSLPIGVGDVLALTFFNGTGGGDFAGVSFSIEGAPHVVPAPGALFLALIGFIGISSIRKF